jgi:transposase
VHREFIELALSRGRNAMAIYQSLVDDHGFTQRYSAVSRFVRKLQTNASPEARVVIQTPPGEEAQVDYGEGPMVRDESGRYRRTRLFVMTLGYSRKSVRLLTWRSSSRIWAELHERSFRRLGGAPRLVVLDNLREGVLTADVYEPALNPLYADVLKHYGVVPLPCRVGDPDRKGKVESAVGHAQKTPLKGLRFETLDEAQQHLDRWEERWADTRIHGTTKRQVSAMFAEEKPQLKPLPVEPFRYYEHGERVVHLDGNVEVAGAYYAAGPGRIGERMRVQWDDLHVRLLDVKTGQLVREYARRSKGYFSIRAEDRPSKTPEKATQLLARAARAGANIGKVAALIYAREPDAGVRRILGLLSKAKKHGVAAVEHACGIALDAGVPTYRFVKTYLERHPPAHHSLRHVDPLIRELTQYRLLIENRTKENAS